MSAHRKLRLKCDCFSSGSSTPGATFDGNTGRALLILLCRLYTHLQTLLGRENVTYCCEVKKRGYTHTFQMSDEQFAFFVFVHSRCCKKKKGLDKFLVHFQCRTLHLCLCYEAPCCLWTVLLPANK